MEQPVTASQIFQEFTEQYEALRARGLKPQSVLIGKRQSRALTVAITNVSGDVAPDIDGGYLWGVRVFVLPDFDGVRLLPLALQPRAVTSKRRRSPRSWRKRLSEWIGRICK